MISAILLAAGQSKRVGKDNKLTIKYNRKYLINHILETLIKSDIKEIIIVLGFQNLKVKKILTRSKKIILAYNKNYRSGIASSIKIGIKKTSKKNLGFLILQADMPLISKEIINSLCKAMENNKKEIFVPVYKKKKGNPIGFKNSMIKTLNKIKGDSGAKKIIKRNKKKIAIVKVNSDSVFKNFNTKKDFLV